MKKLLTAIAALMMFVIAFGPTASAYEQKGTYPFAPLYQCDSLMAQKMDRSTFVFTTNVTTNRYATIVNYYYNFADGYQVFTSRPDINHTFGKPGTYRVVVEVRVQIKNVWGDQQIPKYQTVSCSVTITVENPPKRAESLRIYS